MKREINIESQHMKKKRYLTPTVCQILADKESPIMQASCDQKRVTVDPFDEDYYGEEGNDDYLIK